MNVMAKAFVAMMGLLPASLFAEISTNAWLRGVTDKDPVSYRCGEKMTFTISPVGLAVPVIGDYALEWRRSGDDGLVETGCVSFVGSPFEIKTQIDRPGFVRIEARVVGSDGKPSVLSFEGGAGAEPEKLEPRPEPADFDAFLARQRERLSRIPMTARRKYLHSGKHTKVYAVEVDCAGLMPVTGYLMVPHGTETGARYPACLQLDGYGYAAPHEPPKDHWLSGQIMLSINAHGMRLPAFGGDAAYYKALGMRIRSNGCRYAFDTEENKDPETAYFNGMLLRVMRALQYLKSLPEWNGAELVATGGSQGGLQTFWAAGCGEGVTRAEPAIPWGCDFGGELLGRNRGDWFVPWAEGLGYFDAVNFAKRVPRTCKVNILRAGLGDYCCPPSGIAILWNCLRCPKVLHWEQGATHDHVSRDRKTTVWNCL